MLQLDSFSLFSIVSFLIITGISLACATRKDLERLQDGQWVCLIAGTVIAYATGSLWLFAIGWALTSVPFGKSRASFAILGSALLLLVGAAMPIPTLAFGAIALAALVRKGIFPFHFWVPLAFEDSSLPAVNLFLNSHLGAYVIVRFGLPMYPQLASQSLGFIGALAILTSVYAAFLALATNRPRRILALLCVSQASFILAGFENRNVEGISGALLHGSVVAFATTILITVYGALEARSTEVRSPNGFLGLGYHAPRLAVFFAVAVLSLVGLPGTLGFAAEDLLFHGSLASHPLLGMGLPFATALNAITGLRLIATLFWGRRGLHVPVIPDALPRERWVLTVPLAILVVGGLAPGLLLNLRAPAAEAIAGLLGAR